MSPDDGDIIYHQFQKRTNKQTNSCDDSIGDNNNKQTKINYNDKDDVEIIYCSVFH